MNAWKLYRNIKIFLETTLNAQLAIEAAADQIVVSSTKAFAIGWRDPFNLKEYNSLLIVPDTLRRANEQLEDLASVAIIAALKASTPDALADQMGVYADAIATVFEADPTAGGKVFEAQTIDFDFSLPAPGAPLVGALTIILSVQLDRIYE